MANLPPPPPGFELVSNRTEQMVPPPPPGFEMVRPAGGETAPQQPYIEGLGRQALQGVTLGFGDELLAAGKTQGLSGLETYLASINPGAALVAGGKALYNRFSGAQTPTYDEALVQERALNKQFQAENPVTSVAAQVAGAVPTAAIPLGPLTNIARGAGLGTRMLAGAGQGAVLGGATGFGQGEGGPEARAVNSLEGAGLGAALGGAIPAAVAGTRAVVSGAMTPFRAAVAPERVAGEKLAEALARDYTPGGQVIGRQTFQRIGDKLDDMVADKPRAMLADVGGENTRNLIRASANMPSTGAERIRKSVDARQSTQWKRIEDDMAVALGKPEDYKSAVESIVSRRQQAAQKDFADAFAQNVSMTPQLQSVLQRPDMTRLIQQAERAMLNEGKTLTSTPPMEALHRIKLELDEMIGAARKGQGPTTGYDLRTLLTLKRDFIGSINNPKYRTALDNFAGESALKSAAEDGFETALKMAPEDIAQTIGRLRNRSEQDMWRLGAARAIAGKIEAGNVTRDRTENLFSSPDMQKRLAAIFPDRQSLREFQRKLVIEAKMADTRKALQGGPTTAKQLAQGDEAGQPMRAAQSVASLAKGSMEGVLNYLSRQMQRFSGLTPSVASSILEQAMARDGQEVMRRYAGAMRAAQNSRDRQQRLVQELIAVTSNLGGQAVSP